VGNKARRRLKVKYKIIKEIITGENPEIDLPEGVIILGYSYRVVNIGGAENPKPVETWTISYLKPMQD